LHAILLLVPPSLALKLHSVLLKLRLRPQFHHGFFPEHVDQGMQLLTYALLLIPDHTQFESKSSRAKGIAFHPKRYLRALQMPSPCADRP
jgi:hypothetical protein